MEHLQWQKWELIFINKDIEEDPVFDCQDDHAIDEEDKWNIESTDTSKNNSEWSPPKEFPGEIKREIDITDYVYIEHQIQENEYEKQKQPQIK